jgi:hypothetical protein
MAFASGLYVVCAVPDCDSTDLAVVRESWDAIDRIFVGEQRCDRCGAAMLYSRRPTPEESAMKKNTQKIQKRKAVPYRFLRPESELGQTLYTMLRDLVAAFHHDVIEAKFALAWNTAWQPDVDGRCVLGKCVKVSDLHREVFELEGYDFVIILRQEFWMDPRVTDHQRRALLDHELCHAATAVDDAGDRVIDERGRIVYRIRKHDVEDFACIADRYGSWTRDLEAFAAALGRARSSPQAWVGYQGLKDKLAAAGASVTLEIILEWTEAERRVADVWATLRKDLKQPNIPGASIEIVCPEHVTAALAKHESEVAHA